MKKLIAVLLAFSLLPAGCTTVKESDIDKASGISKEIYYTTSGYDAALSGKYMLFRGEKGLQIMDLDTKEIIKEILPPFSDIRGYAIEGTKVVYSACNSPEDKDKDALYDETANTDIFLYDIADDSTVQITADEGGQVSPDVWGDYIVWMDNRNDNTQDKNPEWDIYLYQISTKTEILITKASGIHTNPEINDNKVVWEDGRNFKGESALRWGSNLPENNTDIYMYDIETGRETAIATEKLQECSPFVYGDYIAWEDRNQGKYDAEIYLYNISTKEKTRITQDKYDQRNPKIYDKYLVWMDERNGTSSNDVIINGNKPNSDIFLYDIEKKKEYRMTGDEPQVSPDISENYLVFITSRQINPEINVIKYR